MELLNTVTKLQMYCHADCCEYAISLCHKNAVLCYWNLAIRQVHADLEYMHAWTFINLTASRVYFSSALLKVTL